MKCIGGESGVQLVGDLPDLNCESSLGADLASSFADSMIAMSVL